MLNAEAILKAAETVVGLLQIISFAGRFPAVIDDAVRDATMVVRTGSSLCLAPIPQLVALKLYAGGRKSMTDIVELLERNPEVDLAELRAQCERYRLPGLDALIAESSVAARCAFTCPGQPEATLRPHTSSPPFVPTLRPHPSSPHLVAYS